MTTRSILAIICCLLLVSAQSWAAFNAATAWDVRTTGSDANGGGFQVGATGTDRSIADSPFQSYTDILIDAATTKGSSAAHAFDVTTPGNIFNITGATDGVCTVQRVQAVSQVAGLVTFDKVLGNAGSHCIGVQGGGLATPTMAASLWVGGNSIFVKTGTYTTTATISMGASGNKIIQGYNTTHDDFGTAPLITTATNSTPLFTGSSSSSLTAGFSNLSLSNTAAVRSSAIQPDSGGAAATTLYITKVSFDGFTTAILQPTSSRNLVPTIRYSEFKNCSTGAVDVYGDVIMSYTYMRAIGTGIRERTGSANVTVLDSVIANNSGSGINSDGDRLSLSNSTIANHGVSGVLMTGSGKFVSAINNIIYGNTSFGITVTLSSSASSILLNNAFGANGTDTNNLPTAIGSVTLVGDPFTNSGTGDYSLNNTAGAGAACRQTGFPGVMLGGATTGYADIGAIQAQATAGGGTTGSAFAQ